MALATAKMPFLFLLSLITLITANPVLISPSMSSNTTLSISTNLTNAADASYIYQIHCTGDTTTLLNTCSSTDYYPETCTKNCTCDCTGAMTCRALGTGQDCDAKGVDYICRQGDGGPNCACALSPVQRVKGDLLGPVGASCTGTPSAGIRGFVPWPAAGGIVVLGIVLVSAMGSGG